MTVSLNHVTLSGNLARDPALEVLPSGHVVCELTVACQRRARDPDGGGWTEWRDYIPVRAFGHQARTCHAHLRRGSGVAIVGRVGSRKVSEPGGEARWAVEVVAHSVQFIDGPVWRRADHAPPEPDRALAGVGGGVGRGGAAGGGP